MNLEDRYAVHHKLPEIGVQGQKKLNEARIAIVGLGGLGSNVALGLVSLGIGHITLIDDDHISASNLSRQVLYQEADIQTPKVIAAVSHLKSRNAEVHYTSHQQRLTSRNASTLLSHQDIVIDGTDTIAGRMAIDAYCSSHNIPFIYGGVKGFMGHISVFNYHAGKSFKETFNQPEKLIVEENCNDSGVIYPVVAVVANLQVMQAFNILLEKQPILQGTLQVVDLKNMIFKQFTLV